MTSIHAKTVTKEQNSQNDVLNVSNNEVSEEENIQEIIEL